LEAFLARIYSDSEALSRFLEDPRREALAAGLDADQAEALERIDRPGLLLASRSFEAKRRGKGGKGGKAPIIGDAAIVQIPPIIGVIFAR